MPSSISLFFLLFLPSKISHSQRQQCRNFAPLHISALEALVTLELLSMCIFRNNIMGDHDIVTNVTMRYMILCLSWTRQSAKISLWTLGRVMNHSTNVFCLIIILHCLYPFSYPHPTSSFKKVQLWLCDSLTGSLDMNLEFKTKCHFSQQLGD